MSMAVLGETNARAIATRNRLGRVMAVLAGLLAALPSVEAAELRLTAHPSPAVWGTPVTVRAQVAMTDGRPARGRLVFGDGELPLATGELVAVGVGGGLAGSFDHVCALAIDGAPWCWGAGGSGRLGNDQETNALRPVAVSGVLPPPAMVATGGEHGCMVSEAGGVFCWGNGANGQLGTGDRASSRVPVAVPALAQGVAAVSLGSLHGCALTRAGGVLCWGAGGLSQIGDGDAVDRPEPVPVAGLASGVTALAVGSAHGCALTDAGTVKCWGNNYAGQIGDGTRTTRSRPVDLPGLVDVIALTAGDRHTCALLADGGAKCWGANDDGRLGDGTVTARLVPTAVVGLGAPLAAISAGGAHTCGVTTAGAALCWGYGAEGRLGTGSTEDSSVPVGVAGLGADVVAVAAGGRHGCAQRIDGVIECWGSGRFGQVGDGGSTARTTPVSVAEFVSSIRARAEARIVGLDVGPHRLVAAVEVSPGEPGGDSGTVDLVVVRAASLTDLAVSPAASRFGEAVTLDARSTGRGVPAGLVHFRAGARDLGVQALDADGRAAIVVRLPVGEHALTATYDGDDHHDGSGSTPVAHSVGRGGTTTSLTASADRTPLGVPLDLTAEVVPVEPAAGIVGGTVTFTEGGTPLGTLPLDDGRAVLTRADLAPGTHRIVATSSGDGDFASSAAASLDVEVTRGATATRLDGAGIRLLPGAPSTLTARVAPIPPAEGGAAGEVDFDDGITRLGHATLVAGTATLTVASTTTGEHAVTARYRGSTRFLGSASATGVVTVDPRVGPEFRVDTAAAATRQRPAVTALAGGDHVVAWATRAVGGRGEIRSRRFRADGSTIGGEVRVDGAAVANRSEPAIAATADGGYVAVWRSLAANGVDLGLWGRRHSSTGLRLGGEFRLDSGAGRRLFGPPSVAARGGGFATVWGSAAATREIRLRIYDAAGRPIVAETKVNAGTALPSTTPPAIAALGAGGWVVAWVAASGSGAKPVVHARRLTARGRRSGGEFVVSPTTVGATDVAVAGTGDGGFVVAWIADLGDGGGRGVHIRRYRADGAALGVPQRIDTVAVGDRGDVAVTGRPGGGFLAAWSATERDGSGRSVHARRFDAAGTALDVEYRLNATVTGDQFQPAVAYRGPDAFLAVWVSRGRDGSGEGIFGQRFATAPQ